MSVLSSDGSHWPVQLPAIFKEPEWTFSRMKVLSWLAAHMITERPESVLGWFAHHGKHGGKPVDKIVSGKILLSAIKQAAYLWSRYCGSASAGSWVCFPHIPTVTWQKHNGFLLVWSQLQARETAVQRESSPPSKGFLPVKQYGLI